MYKIGKNNSIIRIEDNSYIPVDLGNNDYQEYLSWLYQGNQPEPYVPTSDNIPEPIINNSGLARFTGTNPVSVYEQLRMSGITRISKGRYRVYHVNAYPSDQYCVMLSIYDPIKPLSARATARTTTYVEVKVTDNLNAPQDPQELTIKTERVIQ